MLSVFSATSSLIYASFSPSLQTQHSKVFSLKLYAAKGQLSPNNVFL